MHRSSEKLTASISSEPPAFWGGVSVGLIVRNEEKNIERCLAALLEQEDFPWLMEVLVVDNASTDGTLALVDRIAQRLKKRADIRVIEMPCNNMGAARDAAVRAARFRWIAFTDADCVVPKRWLRELKGSFVERRANCPELAAIGTCNEPPSGCTEFQDALRLMFAGFLGHLNSPQAKVFLQDAFVDHLSTCSVFYDRQDVLDAGGFSSRFGRVCEDVDMSRRLRANGRKLMMLSSIRVTHFHQASHREWFKKIFRYGWGRILALRHSTMSFAPTLLLPPLFIFTHVGAISIIGFWAFAFLFAVYVGFLVLVSAWISHRHRRWDLWHRIAWLHLITHFAYSLGMIWGLRFLLPTGSSRKVS